MNKKEFLKKLEETLQGDVDKQVIDEQIKYYNDYINAEIKNGKSEAEVLNELGSPLLIAKTIIDIEEQKPRTQNENYNNSYNNDTDYSYTKKRTYKNKPTPNPMFYTNGSMFGCIIGILLLMIVLLLVLRFIGAAVSIFFFSPAVVVVLIVGFMLYYIGKNYG